jgi:hypothetical protein
MVGRTQHSRLAGYSTAALVDFSQTINIADKYIVGELVGGGSYVVIADLNNMVNGDVLEIMVEVPINDFWRVFCLTELTNKQTEPAYMLQFNYVEGVRVTLRMKYGNPLSIYAQIRRL